MELFFQVFCVLHDPVELPCQHPNTHREHPLSGTPQVDLRGGKYSSLLPEIALIGQSKFVSGSGRQVQIDPTVRG